MPNSPGDDEPPGRAIVVAYASNPIGTSAVGRLDVPTPVLGWRSTVPVVRIPVGEGSLEGRNSAYLLPDRKVVVDPGPPGDTAWDALESGIRDAGSAVSDVDHVFVTHWHVDHAGLAVRLAERADATVHMHVDDAPLVGDYVRERRRRLERDADRLRGWGVPSRVVDRLIDADSPTPLPNVYPVESHGDGDRVAGLSVLHTPGHTLGHAALVAPDSGRLFAGDAILSTYTPNVGGGDTRLVDPLSTYLETIERIADLGWTSAVERDVRVHPGHGVRVDFPGRLQAICEHHDERSTRVLSVLRDLGPATPWTIATELFGDLGGIHVKLGVGEAAAHLERGSSLGRVRLVDEEPRRYEAVSDRSES